ncbi:MAG: fibronectin type III domain-containing protein [Planctomycetes bacterium]|nr:fibronectin type III domain-containing protein [Planctomycetota bacterium]
MYRLALVSIPALLAACGSSSPARISATVQSVTYPQTIAGVVPLRLAVVDDPESIVDVVIEISTDDGRTWRPATVEGRLTGIPAPPAGNQVDITWDSLADVGFRATRGVRMRLSARNEEGRGPVTDTLLPAPDNLPLAASRVRDYFIHYGAIDARTEAIAKTHDLVVLHPHNGGLRVDVVRRIQQGVDPRDPADDVIVLAYISIGEDLRTVYYTDAEMLLDPRFVGDGSGPRVDPRGPDADDQSLAGIDPLGAPSNGGGGYASFYLDDNSVDRDPNDVGDGLPDRNAYFGGCFVNAGDPAWFDVLENMTVDGIDGVQGIKELLTTDFGRGYGCDGLFLDTIDTCAPNLYTDENSGNQSEFEWTGPGFAAFIHRLKERYPNKIVLQNRGLFFYDKRRPHYEFSPRSSVDFLLFESYRLNSNSYEEFDPYYFPDNKYNVAPKLMAEANRPDGFRVLSLGYAEGPAESMSKQTLVGGSTLGLESLLEDIHEAEDLAGFRHYITDGGVVFANTFVREHATTGPDTTAPVWSSTYNVNAFPWPTPAGPPVPRVGIQDVEPGPDCVTIRWDVALDLNRVGYVLYYQSGPFDFVGDPSLTTATRVELTPELSDDYLLFAGHPYQATITGLATGTPYWFCVRAIDEAGNEDDNQVALTATPFTRATITIDGSFDDWALVPVLHRDPADAPPSAGPDWLDVQITNDADWLYLRFTSEDPFNLDGSPTSGYSRTLVLIDADNDPRTGWRASVDVGSELLIAGDELFRQQQGEWNVGLIDTLAALPRTAVTTWEMRVPLQAIFDVAPNASRLRLRMVNDDVDDIAPDVGAVLYTLATR